MKQVSDAVLLYLVSFLFEWTSLRSCKHLAQLLLPSLVRPKHFLSTRTIPSSFFPFIQRIVMKNCNVKLLKTKAIYMELFTCENSIPFFPPTLFQLIIQDRGHGRPVPPLPIGLQCLVWFYNPPMLPKLPDSIRLLHLTYDVDNLTSLPPFLVSLQLRRCKTNVPLLPTTLLHLRMPQAMLPTHLPNGLQELFLTGSSQKPLPNLPTTTFKFRSITSRINKVTSTSFGNTLSS
jgi:hypothetical protein